MTAVSSSLLVIAGRSLPSLAGASIRVLREYERAVVFRLGRLIGQKGPGLVLLIPVIDRMVRVDLRTVTLDDPAAGRDHARQRAGKVNAVAYFRVVDPSARSIEVEDYLRGDLADRADHAALRARQGRARHAARPSASSSTRSSSRSSTSRPSRGASRSRRSRSRTSSIPQEMQRAMARQAEAERERRAKIINAEGEFQAAAAAARRRR